MILRPYQTECINAIRSALNRGVKAPCVSVATGGGKSAIVSELCRTFITKGHRTLVLTASKELISQLSRHATEFGLDHGIYAAALKRRDTKDALIIAQIQSVWRRMTDLGTFTCVIIDENHQVSSEDESMYFEALKVLRLLNPNLRLIGLSATPWRQGEGFIYGEGKMFEELVYHVKMSDLIAKGYLTPLIGKDVSCGFDPSKVTMRCGDFAAGSLERHMIDDKKVAVACAELVAQTQDRRKCLVFSSGLKHNDAIATELRNLGQKVVVVDGTLSIAERDRRTREFTHGDAKFLINACMYTTGFDFPAIDCVAILRPTRSAALLLQMVGRGLRKAEGKTNCKILDYGSCLTFFGPLDKIEDTIREESGKAKAGTVPSKLCPSCREVLHAAVSKCHACGYVFPKSLNHEETASGESVMSTQMLHETSRLALSPTRISSDGFRSVRVQYISPSGDAVTEFFCLEHGGFPTRKAIDIIARWPMKESGNRRLRVEGNDIVGYCNGEREVIRNSISLCNYECCFAVPRQVSWVREGKYATIIKRWF